MPMNPNRFSKMIDEEEALLSYIKDSYQFCAYKNSKTANKRHSALILFDNISLVLTILLGIIYVKCYLTGTINWQF